MSLSCCKALANELPQYSESVSVATSEASGIPFESELICSRGVCGRPGLVVNTLELLVDVDPEVVGHLLGPIVLFRVVLVLPIVMHEWTEVFGLVEADKAETLSPEALVICIRL